MNLGTLPALALAATFVATDCRAETSEMIPVLGATTGKIQALLETHIYRPAGAGPFPIAILNHGSAGGDPKATSKWEKDGVFLASRGYVVLAPMRRGRGRSTGESPESEDKNCDEESWLSGLADSMRDIDATIDFARTLPGAKPHDVLLLGVSRGGFLSVAYAAQGKYRSDVKGVVNFVGGWVANAEDQCPTDFNLTSFRKFGRLATVPMLWLYGSGDSFYGDEAVTAYARAFRTAGGRATFYLIDGVPENGHWLPSYRGKWEQYVSTFLRAHNAP